MSRARWAAGLTLAGVLAVSACSGSGAGGGGGGGGTSASSKQTITVAVVDNPQMTDIEHLTKSGFEADHPNINVRYVTLNEDQLRDEVTKDVATGGGQFDVVMIGPYEVPIWAKNGWIKNLNQPLTSDASYDVNDLIKPIREALSVNGQLYAAPFYGESSFLMYRKDLVKQAGLTMPAHPTWNQVAAIADKLNNPSKGIAGICLRGLPSWGDNMAAIDTLVNTYGGQWYNSSWQAQLTSPAFEQAVNFYVNLIRKDGERGATSDSYNQCANLVGQGKAAMWYDATVGAGTIEDPADSKEAGKFGFVPAPTVKTQSAGWLWSWALAEESKSKHSDADLSYIEWATSKQYIDYAGQKLGWVRVPPGSRYSTYSNPNYQKAAAAFAQPTLNSINAVNFAQPGVTKNPYPGVQYVGIPEFENLGTQVGQDIADAIAGKESVQAALSKAQSQAQTVGKNYQ